MLLNGRRMASGFGSSAVDISALPLTAIKQVEILTDGASAIYGADAVGGVVNFILRDDFKGAETRLLAGEAPGNVDQYRVSQVFGDTWGSGNALLSSEYYKRDLLLASDRSFVPSTSLVGSLLPADEDYSLMFTGKQSIVGSVTAFSDVLFTHRQTHNDTGATVGQVNNATNPQTNATAGLDIGIAGDWQVETSGTYSRNHLDSEIHSSLPGANLYDSTYDIWSGQVKADGTVWTLPGGKIRAALGAEWRSESYDYANTYASGQPYLKINASRIVRSAFGEFYVPVIGEGNALPWARRIEVSLAGRFDDYSSFGSSFNPKYGVMWEPIAGLRFRSSYSTSYRAPKLYDYDLSGNAAVADYAPDPVSPTGTSHQLYIGGTDVGGLAAERSKDFSLGLEFTPPAIRNLKLGLDYYKIEYRDQIAQPGDGNSSVILSNPAAYGSLITRNPTVAQVDQGIAIGNLGVGFYPYNPDFSNDTNFNPASIAVIIDARTRNLSLTDTRGIDLSAQYDIDYLGGQVHLGLSSTYILDLTRQITQGSLPINVVSTIYNPPHFRVRGAVGWDRAGFSANVFVNDTGPSVDNRTTTLVPMASFTTFDMRVAYDFSHAFASGFLSGTKASVGVLNAFNRYPPQTAIINPTADMGFDPTNADPMGRLITVEFVKSW